MIAKRVHYLYAHIPFCPSKCSYCAFVTHVGSTKLIEPYVDALITEIADLPRFARPGPLDTVYLGGGTPSILSPGQISEILVAIDRVVGISACAEVTMEAHPRTVDRKTLLGFRDAGVTRISFGGESLNSGELTELGRGHTAGRVLETIAEARAAKFASINIDLMYGLPTQTVASWEGTLASVLGAAPDHLSLYPLSIEPRTVFARRVGRGQLELPDDGTVVEMYHHACDRLEREGYQHYEIANWARPGYASRHNLAYWRNREFYGVGVGAHGYLHPHRTENVSQTRRYIDAMVRGSSPVAHREPIDGPVEASETVMLGLRLLREGLDLDVLAQRFDSHVREKVEALSHQPVAERHMRREGNRLLLREEAVPLANDVWQRFMDVGVESATRITSAV